MSVTNDFLPFATGGGANVESQAEYTTDTDRTQGNQPGVASSALNNKAFRQATFVASQLAQLVANQTGTDTVDDGDSVKFLAQLSAALVPLPSTSLVFTSGTGTWNAAVYFFCSTFTNATAGATYTNNGVAFTVTDTVGPAAVLKATGSGLPVASGNLVKTSGTGDATIAFRAFRAPMKIHYDMVGAGGGGEGSGSTGGGDGGLGGDTTFGPSTASGGLGGSGTAGSVGGAATLGSGPIGLAIHGSGGSGTPAGAAPGVGGLGGVSAFGGGARGPIYTNSNAPAASTNSGSGGSGATSTAGVAGGGGGSGAYVSADIYSPLLTYNWGVGAAGTAGTASSGGNTGGAGGSGIIRLSVYY